MLRRADSAPARPRVRWAPGKVYDNDADDAIYLATSYNLAPDAWQADILQAWFARRRDGKYCYGRCGLAVPRQNGKNGAIEIRELYGMLILGEAFLHTAHEVKTARKAFKRLKYFFGEKANDPGALFPELNARVREVRNTNGQEAIFLHDVCGTCSAIVPQCQCGQRVIRRGGSIEFVARSKGSGRGFTVDVLVLDEAQHLTEEELEAIRPAISSAPLGNSQVIYTGTPPNRDKGAEMGEAFTRIRSKAGTDKRLCWIEYGAPDGPLPDLDNKDLLYAANPALELVHANGAFGLSLDVVRDERADLSPDGYARERLGWWGDPKTKHHSVISIQRWAGLKMSDAPPPARAVVVLDVSPNLEWAAIGVATTGPNGKTLVLAHHSPGTSWPVAKLLTLRRRIEIVEVALTPNAQIFKAKLTKYGIEHHLLTNTEIGRGCTAFQEMVRAGTVGHLGQAELDAAVRNARTKFVGDTQHWDQRDRSIDMTALVATSVAGQRWAVFAAKPSGPPPKPVGISDAVGYSRDDDVPDWNTVPL